MMGKVLALLLCNRMSDKIKLQGFGSPYAAIGGHAPRRPVSERPHLMTMGSGRLERSIPLYSALFSRYSKGSGGFPRRSRVRCRPWQHQESNSKSHPIEEAIGVELLSTCAAIAPRTLLVKPVQLTTRAAGLVCAVGRCLYQTQWRILLENTARSEAVLSAFVLVAVPLFLRQWARMESKLHDTLECRNVMQTYLVAAGGSFGALLAAWAGNSCSALGLQVIWRLVAARSLWTWTDLGRGSSRRPGWLHGAAAKWRVLATYVALAGAAIRLLALAAGSSALRSAFLFPASVALGLAPEGVAATLCTPDKELHLSIAQLGAGFSLYLWVSYYLCFFLPYRILHDDYQSYRRRAAQFCQDLDNGAENGVMIAPKVGPDFSKPLAQRIARMAPGHERDLLGAIGIFRQKSCSQIVKKAAKYERKGAKGERTVKMRKLDFGDMSHWGSNLFERMEEQERRDNTNGGWKEPLGFGSGVHRVRRAIYSRLMREIQVELGKTDEEMRWDPELSLSNLMRFDPSAEEGEFELFAQVDNASNKKKSDVDVPPDRVRMSSDGHEMTILSEPGGGELAKEAGVDDGVSDDAGGGMEIFREDGSWDLADEHRIDDSNIAYSRDDAAGQALEDAILSRKGSRSGSRGESPGASSTGCPENGVRD